MKYLLSLDLSTTCTGYSLFEIETKKLITYGTVKPKVKGVDKLVYPEQQLTKMINISEQLRALIDNLKPSHIVIEEIAGSRQRLGQKVLDGLHWVLLMHAMEYMPVISYYDVTGSDGWRTHLELKMTAADKINNKEAKALNKKLGRGQKLPIVDPKVLAARYVNSKYGLNLDPNTSQSDSDIGDSIAIGDAWLRFRCIPS